MQKIRGEALGGEPSTSETASDAWLAAIVAASNDAIYGWRPDGTIVSWNAAAERLYGYAAEEAVGRSIFMLIPPERTEAANAVIEEIRLGHAFRQHEVVRLRNDGQRIDVSLTVSPIMGKNGQVIAASTIARGITERKRAEDTLRESEAQLQLIMHAIPGLVARFDADLRYRFVNAVCQDWYGLKSEAIIGRHLGQVIGEDRCRAIEPYYEQVLRGESVGFESVIDRPGSQRREIFVNLVPDRNAAGAVCGCFALATDVTEHKRALEARETHRLLLESMAEGVSLSTEDGTIIYSNPAEDRMFGYGPGELAGRHVSTQNAYPPEENARIVAEVIETLKANGVWRGEWRNRRRDGSQFITAAHITAIELDGRRHWLCVQDDITEQKRAEATLRESEMRFRALADSAPVLIWMSGTDKGGVYFNKPWLDFTGRAVDRELGEGWLESIHPDDQPALETCAAAFEARQSFRTEFRLRRHDGEWRWMLDTGVPRYAPDGAFAGYIGSCIDITERRAVEEALRARTTELDVIMETVPAIVWLAHDPEANRITGSRYAAERLRLKSGANQSKSAPEDQQPQHFRVIKDGRELPDQDLPVQRAARGEEVRGEELLVAFEDGTFFWEFVNASPVRDASGNVVGAVGAAIDLTERKRAEERQTLLMAELDHRVKNTLAAVQSIANHTLPTDQSAQIFTGRLAALAHAHNLLAESHWEGARLHALLEQELAPYSSGSTDRITISGGDVLLAPRTAQTLAMALHELTTNAAKYGALSVPEGRVTISVAVRSAASGERRLALRWIEANGPPVERPSRRGFGLHMIEGSARYELGGEAQLEFHPQGVRCTVDISLPENEGR